MASNRHGREGSRAAQAIVASFSMKVRLKASEIVESSFLNSSTVLIVAAPKLAGRSRRFGFRAFAVGDFFGAPAAGWIIIFEREPSCGGSSLRVAGGTLGFLMWLRVFLRTLPSANQSVVGKRFNVRPGA